jgi:hypothetical protein
MDDILRFNGAVKCDPAIDAWLDSRDAVHRGVVQKWFERMRRCGDDVRELMHDGAPTACIGDVAFGYVNAFKSHVNVGFFNGAKLDDPFELLQGEGKRMRHVKIKPSEVVDAHALDELIRAAYLDGRRRAGVDPS